MRVNFKKSLKTVGAALAVLIMSPVRFGRWLLTKNSRKNPQRGNRKQSTKNIPVPAINTPAPQVIFQDEYQTIQLCGNGKSVFREVRREDGSTYGYSYKTIDQIAHETQFHV